jgi:uncharacterized membrane protein YciS (DUF1049 family)
MTRKDKVYVIFILITILFLYLEYYENKKIFYNLISFIGEYLVTGLILIIFIFLILVSWIFANYVKSKPKNDKQKRNR